MPDSSRRSARVGVNTGSIRVISIASSGGINVPSEGPGTGSVETVSICTGAAGAPIDGSEVKKKPDSSTVNAAS